MITFDIEIFGSVLPLSISNKKLIKEFEGRNGTLLEFIELAFSELLKDDSEVLKVRANKIVSDFLNKLNK